LAKLWPKPKAAKITFAKGTVVEKAKAQILGYAPFVFFVICNTI